MSRHIFEQMDAAVFDTLGDPGTYQAPSDPAPRAVTLFVDKDCEYFPDESGVAERRTEIGLLLSEVGRPAPGSRITDTGTGETWVVDSIIYADLQTVRVAVR